MLFLSVRFLLFRFFVCIVLLFEQNHFDNPRPQLVVTDLELFYPFTQMAWRNKNHWPRFLELESSCLDI